jgi:predicted permease
MPAGFDVMDNHVELFLPAPLNRANRQNRGNHVLSLIGRLKSGVTPDQARTELTSLLATWGERTGTKNHVFTPTGHRLAMDPMQSEIVGSAGLAIGVLQATVLFVLLIACANFANLLLARSEARRREFAVRTALGAGRLRLALHFVSEGVVLSTLGGALGVAMAWIGVRSLVQAFPDGLPRAREIAVDQTTLVVALALAVTTGVVVGLAPLLHVSRLNLEAVFKEGGGRTMTHARHGLRRGLVAAQVALAVILVGCAGLMLRTVANLSGVDSGFDRSRLVTFTTAFPAASYPNYSRRYEVYNRIVSELQAVPGVASVTGMSGLPPVRELDVNDTTFSNFTPSDGGPPEQVDFYQRVEPRYFETMNIPLAAGRGFEQSDLTGPPVAVVNERLARTYWAGLNPIGQTVTPCCDNPTFTVVGVARDVRQGGIDQAAGTEVYFFDAQRRRGPYANGGGVLHVVIRTELPVSVLGPVIERAMREADPGLPIAKLRHMDEVYTETIGRPRMLANLLGGFAGLALLLTAIGTYGVLSYTVAERRRDIGIRMALGAERRRVLSDVIGHGLAPAFVGLAIGVAGGLALTRLMRTMLFGVEPNDPATFAGVALTIVTVAALASVIPAYRASRLDPLAVLRDQ